MNVKQEYDRLREAFKKKDQRKQNYLIAMVADASPHLQYGFVVATLSDNTPVNVQCWTNTTISNGQNIWIAPISGSLTNWYVLIGVNSSSDLGTTPFTPPVSQAGALPVHDLGGASHSGTLPWNRIDTGVFKVNLETQIQGVLPVLHQEQQTSVQTYTIVTPSIAAAGTSTGSITAPNTAYIRNLSITGGANCTFTMYEDGSSTVQYATTSSVATPFADNGGWMLLDNTRSGLWRYSITNNGGSSAVFTIILKSVVWQS